MTTYESPTVDGGHVERVWTTIAAELDGIIAAELIGERRLEREAWFSMRGDADDWLRDQAAAGFTEQSGPTPLATRFHGPTDSPSNAWAVRASRVLEPGELQDRRAAVEDTNRSITPDAIAELEQAAGFEEWSR